MFHCQVVATVIAGTVQLGVQVCAYCSIPKAYHSYTLLVVMDVLEYPQHMLSGSAEWLYLPQYNCLRDGIDHLGCHWPRAPVLARPDVLQPLVLLRCWYGSSAHSVAVHKRFKLNILKYLNFVSVLSISSGVYTNPTMQPVIFSGPGLIPPATPLNYIPWVIIGFIFNYVVRRRHFAW